MKEWTEMISKLGFPIVCCIAMYVQNLKLTDSINSLKELIKENTIMTKTFIETQKGGKGGKDG